MGSLKIFRVYGLHSSSLLRSLAVNSQHFGLLTLRYLSPESGETDRVFPGGEGGGSVPSSMQFCPEIVFL